MKALDAQRYWYLKITNPNKNNNKPYYIMRRKFTGYDFKEEKMNFEESLNHTFKGKSPYEVKSGITDSDMLKKIWSGNIKGIITPIEYQSFMNHINDEYPNMFMNNKPKNWNIMGGTKKYIILEFNIFYLERQNKNGLHTI